MGTNVVHEHGTDRMKFTAVTAHRAGDLVYHKGFYGFVEDDVAAGDLATLILKQTRNLPYVPSTLALGAIVAAPATEQPTSLPIGAASASIGVLATAGWWPIGRVVMATGTATTAKIALFHPNPFAR